MRNRSIVGAAWAASLVTSSISWAGPYAPAAGQTGSTAIAAGSPAFVEWASGYRDYQHGPNVDTQWQTPGRALGVATGSAFDIVSLGDNGQITLTFDRPISNGPGADFAVFENSFSNNFLELAFVEISQDGVNFTRFQSHSLTAAPVSAFGSIDPTNLDGLAGKYRAGYGTPFDLNDVGLSEAKYVRIIDVLGDGSVLDSINHPIYDPTPTVGSGGFDLEAVGVINQSVPEPAGLSLVAICAIALCRRRRQNSQLI